MMRLGERLVVWRDASGAVHVQQDQCPHRAAPLSKGRVVDGLLTCRYHGAQIAGDGTVANVAISPECNLIGQKLVRGYPVVEHMEGIFAYFGDALHPEPVPFVLPYEMVEPDWGGLIVSATWRCNHQYVNDNLNDPMHAPVLHGGTFTHVVNLKPEKVVIEDLEHGFSCRRPATGGNSVEGMEFIDHSMQYWRFDVNYPPNAGPGGNLRIVCFVTPIDADNTIINFWRMRKSTGWQRDLWYFLYKVKLEEFAWQVLEQDREILEDMPPWPPKENLHQHDLGVSRMRRMMRREAEAQVKALETADQSAAAQ
jgi:phenylpropionate dioxygenase-like ring-hydroxylating dioxygenase large terminal subunit